MKTFIFTFLFIFSAFCAITSIVNFNLLAILFWTFLTFTFKAVAFK